MKKGTKIRFGRLHKGSNGIPDINEGDTAVYLGDSKVRMLTGPAAGLVFGLLITATYEEIDGPDMIPQPIKVKWIPNRGQFSEYPALENVETGMIYVDTCLGDQMFLQHDKNGYNIHGEYVAFNIPGRWCTFDQEPVAPIREDIHFALVEEPKKTMISTSEHNTKRVKELLNELAKQLEAAAEEAGRIKKTVEAMETDVTQRFIERNNIMLYATERTNQEVT